MSVKANWAENLYIIPENAWRTHTQSACFVLQPRAAAVEPFLAVVYRRCGLYLAVVTPWKKLGEAGILVWLALFLSWGQYKHILLATLWVITTRRSTLWNSLRLYVSEIPQNSHLCVQPLTGIVCILNGQHTQLQSKQRTVPEMKGRERRGFYVYLVLSIQPAVVVGCVLGASGNVSNVQMHIMSLEKHIRLMRWLNKRLFKRNWGKIFANTMQHNSVYEWEINSRSYKSVREIIVHRLIFLFVSCGDTYCKFRHKWHTQTGLSLCKLGSKIAYAASDPIRNVSHLSKYPVFQMVIIFS